MSTLSGIMLGVVMAAVVTVYYGDVLNRLLPERSPPLPPTPKTRSVEVPVAIAPVTVENTMTKPAVTAAVEATTGAREAGVDADQLAQIGEVVRICFLGAAWIGDLNFWNS